MIGMIAVMVSTLAVSIVYISHSKKMLSEKKANSKDFDAIVIHESQGQ